MDSITALEKEFCPPIDSALFQAIILDYDENSAEGLREARITLEALRESAEVQSVVDFETTGTSSTYNRPALDGNACDSVQDDVSRSETELTGVTRSVASFALDGATSSSSEPTAQTDSTQFEHLQPEEKQLILAEIFPDHEIATINDTLTHCEFRFDRAVDELLNKLYIEQISEFEDERPLVPKSVDGFARPDQASSTRSGRKRNRKKFTDEYRAGSETLEPDTPRVLNKWSNAAQDIDFIVQRTMLSKEVTTSCYHQSGASYRTTMTTLCGSEDSMASCPSATETSVQNAASELLLEFPNLPPDLVLGTVRLSHPSTANAHELVKAYLKSPFSSQTGSDVPTIVPQYRRLSTDHDSSDITLFTVVQRRRDGSKIQSSDSAQAPINAALFNAAREEAFAKAAAAYRKSRSHSLMGGAASYYASVGREAKASADHYSAEAATALAERQSTATQVDLHGLDVKNAVRIALDKVQRWWDSGSVEWARQSKVMGEGGFNIVTGVGKHSQGGKARLGPAVIKALAAEGWRVHDEGGVLWVNGRTRR